MRVKCPKSKVCAKNDINFLTFLRLEFIIKLYEFSVKYLWNFMHFIKILRIFRHGGFNIIKKRKGVFFNGETTKIGC